jgi:hypothetical protein
VGRLAAPIRRNRAAIPALENEGALSLNALHRLEQRYVEALHFSFGARSNLRAVLRGIAFRLAEQGATRSAGHRLIHLVVENESYQGNLNRRSILKGDRPSDTVCLLMIGWFDKAFDDASA